MANYLVQETGDKILLETGDGILLEQQPILVDLNDSVTVSENVNMKITVSVINPTQVWGLKIV